MDYKVQAKKPNDRPKNLDRGSGKDHLAILQIMLGIMVNLKIITEHTHTFNGPFSGTAPGEPVPEK